jgi:hypothetical protein
MSWHSEMVLNLYMVVSIEMMKPYKFLNYNVSTCWDS